MYTVVLGIDESDRRARELATTIAGLPGASREVRAILVHIFTENPEGASVAQLGSVREAREILEDAGVEVELDESSGDPADIILDIADEVDADVVGLGGRKRSPAGKALFGSVTQSVILNTDRPVLVSGTAEKE